MGQNLIGTNQERGDISITGENMKEPRSRQSSRLIWAFPRVIDSEDCRSFLETQGGHHAKKKETFLPFGSFEIADGQANRDVPDFQAALVEKREKKVIIESELRSVWNK